MRVELDEGVVLAAQAEARRQGRSQAAVVEQALREHLARRDSVTGEIWARNRDQNLGEDEARALAYDDLNAMRRERGDSDKAAS
jgi:hypothetical protein